MENHFLNSKLFPNKTIKKSTIHKSIPNPTRIVQRGRKDLFPSVPYNNHMFTFKIRKYEKNKKKSVKLTSKRYSCD